MHFLKAPLGNFTLLQDLQTCIEDPKSKRSLQRRKTSITTYPRPVTNHVQPGEITEILQGHAGGCKSRQLNIHMYLEVHLVASFGNKVFANKIKSVSFRIRMGPKSNDWCTDIEGKAQTDIQEKKTTIENNVSMKTEPGVMQAKECPGQRHKKQERILPKSAQDSEETWFH